MFSRVELRVFLSQFAAGKGKHSGGEARRRQHDICRRQRDVGSWGEMVSDALREVYAWNSASLDVGICG